MSDSSLSVNAVEDGTPQAIVILFGWLGSKSKHIQKYADLYQNRKCSTIFGVADTLDVMLTQKENLSDFGLEAAKEAIKLLKALEDKSVPVILHSFSGAGAMVMEQFTLRIEEATAASKSTTSTQQQEDMILLAEAIQRGGEFFDSSPAYLHTSKGLKAIELGVPNLYLRIIIQVVALIVWVVGNILRILRGKKQTRPEEHWSIFENSNVAARQAYIYSTSDEIVDTMMLEELIEHRKQKPGAKVFVKKFNNAGHSAFLMQHPKEYEIFLDEFLGSILEQKKAEEEILEQDPDMTDYQMEMD